MKETRREFLRIVGGAVAAAGMLLGGTGGARAQQNPDLENTGRDFRPGEKVPTSGVYSVIHDKVDGHDHTEVHQLALTAGTEFPSCKVCRGWARFRLHHAVEPAGAHPDFAS